MLLSTSNHKLSTRLGRHHAYFIEGEKDSILKEIENFLEKELKFEIVANPDYLVLEYTNLSVENARSIREMHLSGALAKDQKRVFVIYFENATSEAQNALLKTFEEPTSSRFFVIAPSVNILLPTLKSRFEIIRLNEKLEENDEAEKFLNGSLGDRIKFAKKMSEKISRETISKSEVIKFLENIHREIREKVIAGKTSPDKLQTVAKALSYLPDKSSSTKILLEYIAISL